MIGTLRFKLPEEQAEFERAVSAGKLASAIWAMAQEFRRQRKYVEHTEGEATLIQQMEDWFHEMLAEYEINLDALCG